MEPGRRERTWEILEAANGDDPVSRFVDLFIMALIIVNVVLIIIESIESVYEEYETFFRVFEFFSVTVFSIEYALRIWSCTSDPVYASPMVGRLGYAKTPMAIIDLLAILPFYLPFVIPVDLRMLRMLRLFRIFRLFKLARYSNALTLMKSVLFREKEMIVVSFAMMLMLLIFSASLMWVVESSAQPESFGSIPDAMWWAVAALTTVGYGDVYPITPLGRILGAVIAVTGIAMFALPAGIFASGFLDELDRDRRTDAEIEVSDDIDTIERLFKLKDMGAITDDEYESEKGKLLGK